MSAKTHQILPHELPRQITANLWQVRGSLPFPLPRNMTIYRLADGSLLLYSVVAMDDAGMAALEALGRPAVMVVPHPFHVMDAGFYKRRYPGLKVVAPEGARAQLAGVGVTADATPEEALPPLAITPRLVPGFRFAESVLELDTEGGKALVVTDLLVSGAGKGLMMKLLGPPGGTGVARIVRFRQVTDKAAVRAFLRELADIKDLRLVLLSHGRPITGDCQATLKQAADRL